MPKATILHIKVPRYDIMHPNPDKQYRIGEITSVTFMGFFHADGAPVSLKGRIVSLKDNGPDKDADMWLNTADTRDTMKSKE